MSYVVIDCETSGLDPTKDAVCEIAAVWRVNKKLVYAHNLINPQRPIPPEVSGVTHLVDADVAGAPTIDRVVNEETFPPGFVVAHNAKFDMGFLPQLSNRTWICTMKLAKHLWPDAPNFKNQTLRYYRKLDVELPDDLAPHRALYDALVTCAIFEEMLKEKPIEELVELQHKPILLKNVAFGKYKGQPWTDVDKGYMRWCLNQSADGGIDDDVRFTCMTYLGLVA